MDFHVHRRMVRWARLAAISVSAFQLHSLLLTAPAPCLIRSQLQLRRLYFNWVDLPPAVLSVDRPAHAWQFPLPTLCFAPTMFLWGTQLGPNSHPSCCSLCFSPPMLPVCGLRALDQTVAHRSHIDIVVSGISSFGYLLLCRTRCVNLNGNTLPFLTDSIGLNTGIEQCFSVFFVNLVLG